jgi:hypothetical protein
MWAIIPFHVGRDSVGCGPAFHSMWAGMMVMWAVVLMMWGSLGPPHGLWPQGLGGWACSHCCSMRVTFVRSGSQ